MIIRLTFPHPLDYIDFHLFKFWLWIGLKRQWITKQEIPQEGENE